MADELTLINNYDVEASSSFDGTELEFSASGEIRLVSVVGEAAKFSTIYDGDNDRAFMSNASSPTFSALADYTVEVIVNPKAHTSQAPVIYKANVGNQGWSIQEDGAGTSWQGLYGPGANRFIITTESVVLNEWVHVAMVMTVGSTGASRNELFLSGSLIGFSNNETEDPGDVPNVDMYLGFTIGDNAFLSSSIYQARISRGNLYTSSDGTFVPSASMAVEADTIGFWDMSEGAGTNLADSGSVGSPNDFTLQNGAGWTTDIPPNVEPGSAGGLVSGSFPLSRSEASVTGGNVDLARWSQGSSLVITSGSETNPTQSFGLQANTNHGNYFTNSSVTDWTLASDASPNSQSSLTEYNDHIGNFFFHDISNPKIIFNADGISSMSIDQLTETFNTGSPGAGAADNYALNVLHSPAIPGQNSIFQ